MGSGSEATGGRGRGVGGANCECGRRLATAEIVYSLRLTINECNVHVSLLRQYNNIREIQNNEKCTAYTLSPTSVPRPILNSPERQFTENQENLKHAS